MHEMYNYVLHIEYKIADKPIMYWAHDQLNVESSKSTLFEDSEKVDIRLVNWISFL